MALPVQQTQQVPQLEQGCYAQLSPTLVTQVHSNIVPYSFATSAIRRHRSQDRSRCPL